MPKRQVLRFPLRKASELILLLITLGLLAGCTPQVAPLWKVPGEIKIKKAELPIIEKNPVWPVVGQEQGTRMVLKYYGFNPDGFYDSSVIKTEPGQEVVAIFSGAVTHIDSLKQEIVIRSSLLAVTYGNLGRILVTEGAWVQQGQRIGVAGQFLSLKGTQKGTSFDLMALLWPDLAVQDRSKTIVVSDSLKKVFREAGITTGLDPELLEAVGIIESGLDPQAVSPKGAQGIMQLMPETAKALGVKNLLDPVENINAGAKHLKALLEKYNDLKLALAAYNAGEEAVRKYNGVPPYPETENYVKAVISLYTKQKMTLLLGLAHQAERE